MRYEKKTFVEQSIVIDGHSFIECKLERCQLIYTGAALPTLQHCSFFDCTWKFDGPAARTVMMMTALYGGGMQELIEQTFENIRGAPRPGIALN